ncbi:hypothetical protein NDU88_003130 [Pleurodeles waltl]|uniref:Uncharacterized protein n=1 Tax=Pleurodeles waltl TaxID=8319 RepID=A0AAV7UXL4_PLEWA|nr:hypothetical protein NDU88_003130 [Pleurodeles waltl]
MGKDRANKGTQQTRTDQYTAQNAGASLPKDPPDPSERGAEPTRAQILAAIESSSRATQTQIAAIAVDVNLLRDDLRVVAERSVATEQKCGTGWSRTMGQERRNPCGVEWWETLRAGGSAYCSAQKYQMPLCQSWKPIVRSDGTLSLERRRQEHEEAKLLVQTVTLEVSSRSGSPCVPSGLSPGGEVEVT